ncbi:MAG: 1-acyl-sn-glycerol-3-phosphate acyltransferase [Spirochaetales bacterium]|jgi:1-acyl-sn-glycerol-3-phosphate acyltransferase|nr:1-acyl-sn-glycerol-3-phosphate acyltransferase [Spirochaetales bacterium]
MRIRCAIVTFILRFLLWCICRIDNRELKALSPQGPMILVMNHINFLEVPILETQIYPRPVRGIVKQETWRNPAMSFLLNTYRAIPLDRDGLDLRAFRQIHEALKKKEYVIIAPEGTRSKDGRLQHGKAGVIQIALASGAPIQPVVHYGGEKIWQNLKRFRRTPFYIKVGRPFRLKTGEGRPGRETRELMLNQIMYQMALLLPEQMRGYYEEIPQETSSLLNFL